MKWDEFNAALDKVYTKEHTERRKTMMEDKLITKDKLFPCVCCAMAPQQDNGFCTNCNIFGCVDEWKDY